MTKNLQCKKNGKAIREAKPTGAKVYKRRGPIASMDVAQKRTDECVKEHADIHDGMPQITSYHNAKVSIPNQTTLRPTIAVEFDLDGSIEYSPEIANVGSLCTFNCGPAQGTISYDKHTITVEFSGSRECSPEIVDDGSKVANNRSQKGKKVANKSSKQHKGK
jgi:hypothetical protein